MKGRCFIITLISFKLDYKLLRDFAVTAHPTFNDHTLVTMEQTLKGYGTRIGPVNAAGQEDLLQGDAAKWLRDAQVQILPLLRQVDAEGQRGQVLVPQDPRGTPCDLRGPAQKGGDLGPSHQVRR